MNSEFNFVIEFTLAFLLLYLFCLGYKTTPFKVNTHTHYVSPVHKQKYLQIKPQCSRTSETKLQTNDKASERCNENIRNISGIALVFAYSAMYDPPLLSNSS